MLETKIDETQKKIIEEKYQNFKVETKQLYLEFKALFNNTTISIYSNSKNTSFKLLINGKEETKIADDMRFNFYKKTKKESILPSSYTNYEDQIGSDEVGFGDFFGPIVVASAYFKTSDKDFLEQLGIKDSKKLTDSKILEIAPRIIKKIKYSLLIVDPQKLTSLFENGYNLNKIKSILHNTVLLNLEKKIKNKNLSVYIDQFTEPNIFYSYISNEPEQIKNVIFKTKGESYFPSVAIASCIARYSFLTKMNELNKKYNLEFPFGASSKVDQFAKDFVQKYGINELKKIVKTNFKNFKKLT